MAASLFSSPLYAQLFPTGDVGRLWTDSAEIRAMLLVEGALATAQGKLGVIPETSAKAIDRASKEVAIDPASLAEPTGRNGVNVPGLIAAFRKEMSAPEHANFVHWGATSQDIIDTALMLRLRQTLAILEARLTEVLGTLAQMAREHAETPILARTYGQHATVTTFGAVVAQWGQPLQNQREALAALRAGALMVSLSGAAGTASALPRAQDTRALLAEALNLKDPQYAWHTDRGPILRIATWMADTVSALGHMGRTLTLLSGSDLGEVGFGQSGASSTMPQKSNPVGASALVALETQMAGLMANLRAAANHDYQRDGAAWFAEWLTLPSIALSCASALQIAGALRVMPNPKRMADNLSHDNGMTSAEALSFALCADHSRSTAQALTKDLVAKAVAEGRPLEDVARAAHPNLPQGLFDPLQNLGDAPSFARAFADRAQQG